MIGDKLCLGLVPDYRFKDIAARGEPTRLLRGLALRLDDQLGVHLLRRRYHWQSGQWALEWQRVLGRHLFHGDRWVGGGGVYENPVVVGADLVVHYGDKEIAVPGPGPLALSGEDMSTSVFVHRRGQRQQEAPLCLSGGHWKRAGAFGFGEREVLIAPAGFFLEDLYERPSGPRSRPSALALAYS